MGVCKSSDNADIPPSCVCCHQLVLLTCSAALCEVPVFGSISICSMVCLSQPLFLGSPELPAAMGDAGREPQSCSCSFGVSRGNSPQTQSAVLPPELCRNRMRKVVLRAFTLRRVVLNLPVTSLSSRGLSLKNSTFLCLCFYNPVGGKGQ